MGAPIVLCIPYVKLDVKHNEHLTEWYAANRQKHDLRRVATYYRATHQAQQRARSIAWQVGASHILFTENDQWGYPVDGLDVLLEADKDVIGFRSYFKRYPYLSMAFRLQDRSKSLIHTVPKWDRAESEAFQRGEHPSFYQIEGVPQDGNPIQPVDLVSWAFTLVRMSVFDRMKAAGLDSFVQWGPVPTDSFFCQHCRDLGIKVFCHLGFTIGHGDVGPNEIPYYRRLHESMRGLHAKPVRVTIEDDFGHPYGEAVYLSDAARALQGGGNGASKESIVYAI